METAFADLLARGALEMGVRLDAEALRRFSVYLDLLQLWGGKMNLSSRLDEEEIVVYHFLDSLSGVRWLQGQPDARVADLGTGAGFPGLPLKIALPGIRLTLIDSSRKKVAFCREVVRAAGIAGATAVWGRAEDLARDPALAGQHDWAVSRALTQAEGIVRAALPFLTPSGAMLLYKGKPSEAEASGLARACRREHLACESHPLAVPGLAAARTQIVVRRGS